MSTPDHINEFSLISTTLKWKPTLFDLHLYVALFVPVLILSKVLLLTRQPLILYIFDKYSKKIWISYLKLLLYYPIFLACLSDIFFYLSKSDFPKESCHSFILGCKYAEQLYVCLTKWLLNCKDAFFSLFAVISSSFSVQQGICSH